MVINTPFGTLAQEFEKMFVTPGINKIGSTYPPHNVIEIDNDEWLVEFAVAGFTKEDIEVTTHKGILTVKGEKRDEEDDVKYIHKGIATRKFVRSFTLPEHTEVLRANVSDGILSVELVRYVPEEQKPKSIPIK